MSFSSNVGDDREGDPPGRIDDDGSSKGELSHRSVHRVEVNQHAYGDGNRRDTQCCRQEQRKWESLLGGNEMSLREKPSQGEPQKKGNDGSSYSEGYRRPNIATHRLNINFSSSQNEKEDEPERREGSYSIGNWDDDGRDVRSDEPEKRGTKHQSGEELTDDRCEPESVSNRAKCMCSRQDECQPR